MKISDYSQQVKEDSRHIIWEQAISSLTVNRNESTIFNPELCAEYSIEAINKIKDFVNDDFAKNQNKTNFDWGYFHRSRYSKKEGKDLKIAYFSGPNPINDLKHLLENGIRPENIWAFELDKKCFQEAKKSILEFGKYINLFSGKISDFSDIYPEVFDIVYLDFTNSLLSSKNNPELVVQNLINNGFLSDLSCLIVNTCFPDKSDSAIDYLTSFYGSRQSIPKSIYDGSTDYEFTDSFNMEGYYEYKDIRKFVENNFEEAYSFYSTAFIDIHTNIIQPITKIISIKKLKDEFFDSKVIDEAINRLSKVDMKDLLSGETVFGFEMALSPESYSNWHFINKLNHFKTKPFNQFYNQKISGQSFTPFDCLKLYYVMTSLSEGYYDAVSKNIMSIVRSMQYSTIDSVVGRGTIFCDLPMPKLWYNLILGKYGYPYHINYSNQKRLSYKAKERTMCVDIFTLDKCRSLYDWLPSIDFSYKKFENFNNQIIIRSYIDKIHKTQFYINNSYFRFGHFLCQNDSPNSIITELKTREKIK